MYSSELFQTGKSALENSLGFLSLFKALPPNTEISISLDDRIPCTLVSSSTGLHLEPRMSPSADLQIILFSESIRRLTAAPPQNMLALTKEISGLVLAGHARIRLLSSPLTLYKKGYVTALKGLLF